MCLFEMIIGHKELTIASLVRPWPFCEPLRAEADINEYEKVAGRDVLMIAMQREEELAPWMTINTNIAL